MRTRLEGELLVIDGIQCAPLDRCLVLFILVRIRFQLPVEARERESVGRCRRKEGRSCLQLDKRIGAAIVVHGQQIDALLHIHHQRTPFGIVAQRDEHLPVGPTLCQLCLIAVLILHSKGHRDAVLRCAVHLRGESKRGKVKNMRSILHIPCKIAQILVNIAGRVLKFGI